MTVLVNGEKLQRNVRRIYKNAEGNYIGWCSLNGRDTKVTKLRRKKTWIVVSMG